MRGWADEPGQASRRDPVSVGPEVPPVPADALRPGAATLPDAQAVVPSDALLRGGKALCIAHNGTVYRLQATRLGKLILTK